MLAKKRCTREGANTMDGMGWQCVRRDLPSQPASQPIQPIQPFPFSSPRPAGLRGVTAASCLRANSACYAPYMYCAPYVHVCTQQYHVNAAAPPAASLPSAHRLLLCCLAADWRSGKPDARSLQPLAQRARQHMPRSFHTAPSRSPPVSCSRDGFSHACLLLRAVRQDAAAVAP